MTDDFEIAEGNDVEEMGKYYKKYKKIAVIAVIFVILFSASTVSALFYQNQYTGVLSDYNDLEGDYDSLSSSYNSLQSRHDRKVNDYNSLQAQHDDLQSSYNSLQSQYNNLQSQYDMLETGYYALDEEYEFYKEQIEVRYGDGGNCKKFITPDNIHVIGRTKLVLGHLSDGDLSWEDKIKINDWVYNTIEYNHDTFIGDRRNCYFYPSETLDLGYGDCEDQAALMASMCKAEEDVSWVYCASVSYIKNGERVGHVFVINNIVDDQMYIFDQTHSDAGGGGWHSSSSMSEPEAISEYESAFGYSSLKIQKIFNEDMYHTFSSNQEFYDYF